MKKRIIYSLIFFFGIFYANILLGNTFQGKQNVNITTEVNDNLYVAGGNIIIEAPVRGDLVGAGGDIIIQDTITEDVLLAGGNLKVMGYIGDDLRIAGGTVVILNEINGDLLIAGGEVTVGKDAIINGEIILAGGKLIMNGTVRGKANIRSGEVVWNGIAEDALIVKAGNLSFNGTVKGGSEIAAPEIEIGEEAQFYGDVEYWNAKQELDFGSALLGGAVANYNSDLRVYDSDFNWKYLGIGIVAFWLYRLLAGALMIALLIWMFHRFFTRNDAETTRNYVSHLGLGFLYVIGLPLLISLTFFTVIGIPVGFILMMFYGVTIMLGHVLAAVLIAYGWNKYYKKNWNRRMLFLASMVSFLTLKIIGTIPLIGFLISLLVVLTAFGTILFIWWKNRSNRKPSFVD